MGMNMLGTVKNPCGEIVLSAVARYPLQRIVNDFIDDVVENVRVGDYETTVWKNGAGKHAIVVAYGFNNSLEGRVTVYIYDDPVDIVNISLLDDTICIDRFSNKCDYILYQCGFGCVQFDTAVPYGWW